MGYETRYHLELSGNAEQIQIFKETIVAEKDSEPYLFYLISYEEFECKWYQHEEDLKELSKQYPFIYFKLVGIGENWGDFWIKYFRNGIMEMCDCEILPKREHNSEDLS